MTRAFNSKFFILRSRNVGITDAKLCEAVRNAERGIINADYGGGVIKQRVSRANEGKSGGYRSIILFRQGKLSFFVYGFAKNERDNMDESDEQDFKKLAKALLSASDMELDNLINVGKYEEVKYEKES